MTQLSAIIHKELLLLSRDIHGLLLLFIMPVTFILIMSLAMQDAFSSRAGDKIPVLLINNSQDPLAAQFVQLINDSNVFALVELAPGENDSATALLNDRYTFLLKIDQSFSAQLLSGTDGDDHMASVTLRVAPSTSRQMQVIFQSIIIEAITRLRLENILGTLQQVVAHLNVEAIEKQLADDRILSVTYVNKAGDTAGAAPTAPSSVQQSVPAWLVFSLFFVVVPLSNTLINERKLGTLKRIQTLNVNPLMIVAGKLIPYFCVNQIQVVLMLLVGMYLVPACGGERLILGNNVAALFLMSVAISCGALGYAMLIAVIARTCEQATTLGGAGNIVLAAIGGIMVPTFIMPEFMQTLSQLSPMAWGLQGFLDIFLRSGHVVDVLPEVAALLLFGTLCLTMAALFFNKAQLREDSGGI